MAGNVTRLRGFPRPACRQQRVPPALENPKVPPAKDPVQKIPITNHNIGALGTPKTMKLDTIQKGHVPKIMGRAFPERKSPCGSGRARQKLWKNKGISIFDHLENSMRQIRWTFSRTRFLWIIPPKADWQARQKLVLAMALPWLGMYIYIYIYIYISLSFSLSLYIYICSIYIYIYIYDNRQITINKDNTFMLLNTFLHHSEHSVLPA